jgi:sugar diacid utilization regulator
MSSPAKGPAGLDLAALDGLTDAVESGAGLPAVIRAASRTLDASVVCIDRAGGVLAVAARSPADERALLDGGAGTESLELRVADALVGTLRVRPRGGDGAGSGAALVRLVTTLVASEVDRLGAPARASERAAAAFLGALLERRLPDRDAVLAEAAGLGLDLSTGAVVVVARAHAHGAGEDGWRARAVGAVARGVRAAAPGAVVALRDGGDLPGAEVVALLPGAGDAAADRAAAEALRELQSALPGHSFALGRSRVAEDAGDLHRAAAEALLAANVAEGDPERPVLAFEETGAYRLLLSAMSEDPAELQRFYAETVEPLVAYDQQYDTDLVATVEAYLEADGNVAGTAQRLFTHRHTVRYRLERVRELSGLDVGSTDGREKLSLGLKAMRVLGIANRGGPATERRANGERLRRRPS